MEANGANFCRIYKKGVVWEVYNFYTIIMLNEL